MQHITGQDLLLHGEPFLLPFPLFLPSPSPSYCRWSQGLEVLEDALVAVQRVYVPRELPKSILCGMTVCGVSMHIATELCGIYD